MNEVKLKKQSNEKTNFKGSIWEDKDSKLYMLCSVDGNVNNTAWCAVCLKNGNRWRPPKMTIGGATEGLALITTKATIWVEDSQHRGTSQ